jgi:pimeloyl-ACP methyl ester carboxylesterase
VRLRRDGEPATGYDKRNMAKDLRELMRALEIPKIALVGHDRGARLATRFAKDHPKALDRLVVMDNIPTRIVARDFNPIMAKAYWFFIFNQIPDLPEALITGREDLWLGHLFADWCYNPHAISGKAFDTYVKAYRPRVLCVVRWLIIAPTPRTSLETKSMPTRRSRVRRSRYGEPISMRWAKCSTCRRSGRKWRRT